MILVVDDDEVIRAVIVRSLEREGLEVEEAVDGLAALAAIAKSRPDVLLLDVSMPGLSGLEVLDRIHGQTELQGMPVILLTGLATGDDIVAGITRGAYDYLTKPFRVPELVARVSAALRTAELVHRLERRNVELDCFAATAAHDLKSPLTIIRGASTLLAARWGRLDDVSRADQFASIAAASVRASRMIEDLLALARFDKCADEAAVTRDPRATVEAVVATAPLLPTDDVRVGGDWAPVAAAGPDLRSALSNLVENACHYGRSADGVLRAQITGRLEPHTVIIDITDAGPGISAEERPKVFQPFYSSAGSREANPESTGVGLAIVRKAAEGWGGSVECLRVPHGTTFRLRLSSVPAAPVPRAAAGMARRRRAADLPSGAGAA